MNRSVFADSYYFIALMNPRDAGHRRATQFARNHVGPMVTSEWVLLEVADAMASAPLRDRFLKLLDWLTTDPDVEIVAASRIVSSRGRELYRKRRDKNWPLTDCLNFAIMEGLDLREAITRDHHFEQAGFVALLTDD